MKGSARELFTRLKITLKTADTLRILEAGRMLDAGGLSRSYNLAAGKPKLA
jgi:hypothetical protein